MATSFWRFFWFEQIGYGFWWQLAKASSVGANTVNGPLLFKVSTNSAEVKAVAKVLNWPALQPFPQYQPLGKPWPNPERQPVPTYELSQFSSSSPCPSKSSRSTTHDIEFVDRVQLDARIANYLGTGRGCLSNSAIVANSRLAAACT